MKISRQDLLKVGFATAVVGIAGVACSDDTGRSPVMGNNGSAGNTGGATGSGGAKTGGATGSGGAKTGGASGSGGAKTGGASGSGGAKTGGASGTGGNSAAGGNSSAAGGNSSAAGGASQGSGGASEGTGGSQGSGGLCTADPGSTMTGDHEHPVSVPLADVVAGVQKVYTLELGGDPQHTHMMTVTPANFTTLKTTGTVTVTSTNDGHTHDVILTCAAPE